MVMLTVFVAIYVAEVILIFSPQGRIKRLAAALIGSLSFASAIGLASELKWFLGVPLILLAIFRLINILRIVKSRMHRYYLIHATRRTALILIATHVFGLYGAVVAMSLLEGRTVYLLLLLGQLTGTAIIFITTLSNVRKLRFRLPKRFLAESQLPTVSVLIPARNETIDLEACLRNVLASDYPKLEIIVLDDCSHAKTADVIKSFAHAGVRFVQGDEPAERWLAKNQAYQKLYKESTGEVLLFIGVDVRLSKTAIRGMVNTMYDRQKSMLSVLPTRQTGKENAVFIQPMRYWWELVVPRRLFNRPPVLSTCWMIDRDFMKSHGGFGSVSHAILPEGYFAREAVKQDGYSFVRSSGDLGVQTAKTKQEQLETAHRVKYPQVRRRPENVLLLTALEVLLFVGPFVTLLINISRDMNVWLPAISMLLLLATHLVVMRLTNPSNTLLAVVTFPLAILYELYLGYASMLKYEFGKVIWKERNICTPVMHTIPKSQFLSSGNIK